MAKNMVILPLGEEVIRQYGLARLNGLLGYVPFWLGLDPEGKTPAAEIFRRHYVGGWHPGGVKFTVSAGGALLYPGDPAQKPLVEIPHGDETVRMYEHAWVAIFQKDGTFEVDRMD